MPTNDMYERAQRALYGITEVDGALICVNGHVINREAGRNPGPYVRFCTECGGQVLDRCPSCHESIRGQVRTPQRYDPVWTRPNNCHGCGQPYPWRVARIENLVEAIDSVEGVDETDRQSVKDAIPDVIAETPKTDTAAARMKRFLAGLPGEGAALVRKALDSVVIQTVKDTIL